MHMHVHVHVAVTCTCKRVEQVSFLVVVCYDTVGLLFAYGITNSGKTYTMSGESDQPGILPRIMDVVFNSIADVQAPKYVCFTVVL